ncbi:hypothetical protein DVH24_036250 [Malus domestica]|uniref:Uncharacterized protein n=1 Tax=Malus domestica TaxID=3750 RepID=A0A498IFU5_MALDO|nr:hypothetical protein DVH24_036250 [Malus domestica]
MSRWWVGRPGFASSNPSSSQLVHPSQAYFTFKAQIQRNGHGLVSLYKDMESCGEYEDIRVMWEIIHSCQQNANNTTRRRKRSSS